MNLKHPRALVMAGCAVLCAAGMNAADAAPTLQSANGQGTLDSNARHFAFNAKRDADGTVTGQAELTNSNFSGDSGHGPYKLHLDISCMQTFGNTTVFGGTATRTNDSNLDGAAYFAVQDNGEPGAGEDQISRVVFYDSTPGPTGDPGLCTSPETLTNLGSLTPIEHGNIQVRPVG